MQHFKALFLEHFFFKGIKYCTVGDYGHIFKIKILGLISFRKCHKKMRISILVLGSSDMKIFFSLYLYTSYYSNLNWGFKLILL